MQIKNKHYFLTLLAFLIFFVALFWFPLTHPQYIFDALDLKLVFSHWYDFMTSEIAQGRLPFWNPFVNSGTPFLAHPTSLLFYPPNWLLFFMPPGFALTLFTLFHFIFGASAMYVLAFRYTKNSLASFASGITYAASGYFAAKLYAGHTIVFASAAWFPLIFYFLEKAIRCRSIGILLPGTLSFAFLILCGFPENTVYFALFASFTLFLLYGKKAILTTTLIFIFGSLLSAFHLLPTMEFVRQTTRAAGMSFEQSVIFSLSIKDLPNLIIPTWFNQYIGSTYPLWEILNYLGVISITAVLIALFIFLSQIIRRILTACHFFSPDSASGLTFCHLKNHLKNIHPIFVFFFTGLLALLLSFGSNLPFHLYEYLWKIIPLFRLFRIPSHFLVWTTFCVSLLVAFGINGMRSKILQIFFVIAICVDSFLFFHPFVRTTNQFRFPINNDLLSFLETHRDGRFFHDYGSYTSWNNLMYLFNPSASTSIQVESVKGSDTMLLKSYADLARVIENQPIVPFSSGDIDIPITNVNSPLFNLLSARYLMITDPNVDLTALDSRRFKLLKTTVEFRIYENVDALPTAFLVNKVTASNNVFEDMRNPNFNPQTEALVDANEYKKITSQPTGKKLASQGLALRSQLFAKQNGSVKIISKNPQKTIFEVTSDAPALLLVTDVYYPGWQAKVDNERTPLVKADGTFRGILIPAGTHEAVMYYQPTIFIIGALISIGTFLILIVLFFSSFFPRLTIHARAYKIR